MSAVEVLTMDMLRRNYPCVPEDRLKDLHEIGASNEQYAKVNENCKKATDKELDSYTFEKLLERELKDPSRPSMVVAVTGASGSGKSATGNTLLREKRFKESSSASSETVREMVVKSTYDPTLTVIDTPGTWELPKESKDAVHLFVFTVNLSSPRFSQDDLKEIRKLKDYNKIVDAGRCILLLTHARDALHGKSVEEYLVEIGGDPLYDLITKAVGRGKVMAINNNCLSSYETERQGRMVDALLLKAFSRANFQPENFLSKYKWYLLVAGIVVLAVIIGLAIFGGVATTKKD